MSTWGSDYTITSFSSSLSQRQNRSGVQISQAPFWFGIDGVQTLRGTCQAYVASDADDLVGTVTRWCPGGPQYIGMVNIPSVSELYGPDTDIDLFIAADVIASTTTLYAPAGFSRTTPMSTIASTTALYNPNSSSVYNLSMSKITNVTNVYNPASFARTTPMSAIASTTTMKAPAGFSRTTPMNAIASTTALYNPQVMQSIPMNAIASTTALYAPASFALTTPMSTIASTTNVYTPCVLFSGSWTTGLLGDYALEFTASNSSYVEVGTLGRDWSWMNGDHDGEFPLELQYQFSVQCWTKFSSIEGGTQAFWGTGQPKTGYGTTRAYFYDDGTSNVRQIWFEMSSGSAGASYSLSSDTAYPNDANWHHVVLTFDRTKDPYGFARLWVDAVEKTFSNDGYFGNFVGSDEGTRAPLCFGFDGSGNPFDGVMDEFTVWNTPLTEGAVIELYNSGAGAAAIDISGSNIVSSFNLEDGPGNSTLANWESAVSASLTGTMKNMNPGSAC